MCKFKKGDVVKAVEENKPIKIGDVGVVDENNSTCPFVKWGNGKIWAMSEDELELVEK